VAARSLDDVATGSNDFRLGLTSIAIILELAGELGMTLAQVSPVHEVVLRR
jgi:hypothetical protein